jgi:hypothetical protein
MEASAERRAERQAGMSNNKAQDKAEAASLKALNHGQRVDPENNGRE